MHECLKQKGNFSVIFVDDPYLPTDIKLEFQKNECYYGFAS